MSLLFLLLTGSTQAVPLELIQGDLPVLIVNVHGGKEPLLNTPTRLKSTSRDPHFSAKKDLVTDVLARRYHQELRAAHGNEHQPTLLISHIHRKYVDLNRPPEYAAEHPAAKRVHSDFHRTLEAEIQRIKKRHGWVLVLDIHGQSAERTDLVVGTCQGRSIGPWATHALWSSCGVLAVLSKARFTSAPNQPAAAYRFGGGYITQHYGIDPQVDVVQLEHAQALRFQASDNTRLIRIVCHNLAEHLRARTGTTWFVNW